MVSSCVRRVKSHQITTELRSGVLRPSRSRTERILLRTTDPIPPAPPLALLLPSPSSAGSSQQLPTCVDPHFDSFLADLLHRSCFQTPGKKTEPQRLYFRGEQQQRGSSQNSAGFVGCLLFLFQPSSHEALGTFCASTKPQRWDHLLPFLQRLLLLPERLPPHLEVFIA